MSTGDLDDLAILWRAEPEPAERAELDQLAEKARRRGRLADYADIGLVAIVVVSSIVATFAAGSALLMVVAAVLIVMTIWLTVKRRRIRQMSRGLRAKGRENYIDGSVRDVTGALRRNLLSLVFIPLVVPLAVLVKAGSRTGGDPQAIAAGLIAWMGTPRGAITLAIVSLIMIFVVRARRRLLTELRRLNELQGAYADETRRENAEL